MAERGAAAALVVEVQYATGDEDCEPPHPPAVRAALAAALPPAAEVTVRFTATAESQAANLAHLGKDRPANVLAWRYPGEPLTGDIAICPAVVEDEARQAGIPAAARYTHLLVHAALHLLGMDHAEPAAARRMERAEAVILERLGLPDPYQEVGTP